MNFREDYKAALMANDQKRIDDLEEQAHEYAYCRACEEVGPNSIEFDARCEAIYEEVTNV